MVQKTVSSTRMELTRLKSRLTAATRRRSIFKNTGDGLSRQISELFGKARNLRAKADKGLAAANAALFCTRTVMSPTVFEQALLYKTRQAELDVSFTDIMSVQVPEYRLEKDLGAPRAPYAFAQTSGELDDAVSAFERVLEVLLELAQCEKTIQLLVVELESINLRVNTLERAVISKLEASIKHISAKLETQDRFTKISTSRALNTRFAKI